MRKSTESRLERKVTLDIYYYFPFKAYFNVASHSAPAFPAPPPQHLLPSGASGARNQHNLRPGAPSRSALRAEQEPPRRQVSAEDAEPPPLGSSHCTSAPRLRPAPAAPAPAPPGSGTPAPRPRHAHSLCSGAPRGRGPTSPSRHSKSCGAHPLPGSAFGCRWGGSRKKVLRQISSLGRVLRLFSATHLCSPFNFSCRFQKVASTPTFLSREEGSCALPSANLPLKERICSRRWDRPLSLAEQHPSCPPALALGTAVFLRSVKKHFFPQSRHRGAPRLLGLLKQDFS